MLQSQGVFFQSRQGVFFRFRSKRELELLRQTSYLCLTGVLALYLEN
jgi:hypothetical protein